MLRLGNNADWLVLELVEREDDLSPSGGDAFVTISVSSSGFTGRSDLWISSSILKSFSRSLVELEQKRQDSARMEGLSPDKLSLTIRSIDRAGHMIAEGIIGRQVNRPMSRPWHAIHFGIEFDPSQLIQVVKSPWVALHAGP